MTVATRGQNASQANQVEYNLQHGSHGFMIGSHTLALSLCPHAQVVINHKSLATVL